MTHICETCAREMGDAATFCATCAHRLDHHIADVSAYHGLAYDLDIATTRQARLTTRDGGRPTSVPVPYDDRASRAARHLKNVLAGWARVIIDETGARPPADELPRIAAWLRPRVGWLRHHPAGAEAHDQITDAVRQARRVCDRPADKLYAGPCDCGTDLYGRLDATYVTCPNTECDTVWSIEERRRWLLDSARDVLASAVEISRALSRYQGQNVTPAALRGYVHRGALVSKGERVEGGRMVMLYRLGDVLDILARQAERVSA